MILIDIPDPETCERCPCSYWIQTGENAGKMMCNAMEFRAQETGEQFVRESFIVADNPRPDGCPIQYE